MKNNELIKEELKNKINSNIDEFVDNMLKGFESEKFSLTNIELLIGKVLNECHNNIISSTEKMINTQSERELISKKKVTGKNEDIV